jgi:hypothetical protein
MRPIELDEMTHNNNNSSSILLRIIQGWMVCDCRKWVPIGTWGHWGAWQKKRKKQVA